MIQTRIDLDDAWPVLEPFAPYLVDVLLDFLDDVNAPGVVAIRRPMGWTVLFLYAGRLFLLEDGTGS